MLDLVAVDYAAGGGGFSLERGDLIAGHGDGCGGVTNFHLHVNPVRLLRDDVKVLNGLGLEAFGICGQGVVIGREGVEVVDAAAVRGCGDGVVGVGVGQGKCGAGDDCSRGIGDCALDGGAELRMCG